MLLLLLAKTFSSHLFHVLLQSEEGWEEFFDYIFPEDEATKPNLKLLEMAKAWKKQQQKVEEGEEEKGTNVSETKLNSLCLLSSILPGKGRLSPQRLLSL